MSILAREFRNEMAEPSSGLFFTEEEKDDLKENINNMLAEQGKMPCSKPAYIGVFLMAQTTAIVMPLRIRRRRKVILHGYTISFRVNVCLVFCPKKRIGPLI